MEDYFFFFQIAALFTYTALYRKLKNTYFKWFLPYLIIVTVYEFGSFNGWFTIERSNHWSFNIISTLEFLFYGFILQHLLKGNKVKGSLRIALYFIFLLTVLNLAFVQGFWKLHTNSYLLQSATIITGCCFYFYQLMNEVNISTPLLKNPEFWLNTGVLFYYLGGFMFFAAFNHMAYKGNPVFQIVYMVVYNFYNIILYSCLIRSFLCFRQTKM